MEECTNDRAKLAIRLDGPVRRGRGDQTALRARGRVRLRRGREAAHFAEAAARNPDFARELPRFVSRVRNMFTADEIRTHLARVERLRRQPVLTDDEFDELDHEDPRLVLEKQRQFDLVKELLTSPTLGTS